MKSTPFLEEPIFQMPPGLERNGGHAMIMAKHGHDHTIMTAWSS